MFRYSFAPKEERNYALDMRIQLAPSGNPQAQPMVGRVRALMTMSVIEKRDDGSTTLELTTSDVKTEPPRPELPADTGRVRLRIAPDGRVLDVKGTGGVFSLAGIGPGALLDGSGGGSPDDAGTQLLFPQYPSGGIKPGDTWSRTSAVPLPFGDQKVNVRTDERFERYEDSPRGRAARLRVAITTPLDYSVTVPELLQAVIDAGGVEGPAPTPVAPKNAKIAVDGRTATDAQVLVLSKTSDLVELTGTTRMSVRMTFSGLPKEQLQNPQSNYSFDALINMSIVRRR